MKNGIEIILEYLCDKCGKSLEEEAKSSLINLMKKNEGEVRENAFSDYELIGLKFLLQHKDNGTYFCVTWGSDAFDSYAESEENENDEN